MLFFALLLAISRAAADFALYDNYGADALIAGLALSSPCLAAL
jgi:hypothetical protein